MKGQTMTGKGTALLLQLSTPDGASRQQMVVLPGSNAVFRRSVSSGSRTQWRWGNVGDLPTWVSGYVTLAAGSAPTPMSITQGCYLMEVTEAEVTEAETKTFPRNVGLRYQRVMDGMAADPSAYPPTATSDVSQYVSDWLIAVRTNDVIWLDAHTHPAGRTKSATPAPAEPVVPEPEDPAPANPYGWTYPATVGGYVTRPNGERYRVRKIEGEVDVELLRKARLAKDHVFLTSCPGTGKTALVEAAFGSDLVTMLGTEDVEPSDFIGSYTPRGGGSYGWTDGALVEAMERGVPLFIDECGVIAPKTMTVLFSVMDGRDEVRVTANPDRGTIKAAPGFFIIGATNPDAPGVRVSEALTSRFGLIVEARTDYGMMRTLGVPDDLVTAAENLDKRRQTGEISWSPQARELLRAMRQIGEYGDKIAVRNLIGSAPRDDQEVVIEVLQRVLGAPKLTCLGL